MNDFNLAMSQARGFLLDATAENFDGIVKLIFSIKDWEGDDPMYTHDVEALERYIQECFDDNPAWINAKFVVDYDGDFFQSAEAYEEMIQDHFRDGDYGPTTRDVGGEYIVDEDGDMVEEVFEEVEIPPPYVVQEYDVIGNSADHPDWIDMDSSAGEALPDDFWIDEDYSYPRWIVASVSSVRVREGEQHSWTGEGGWVINAKIWDDQFGSMIRGD